MVQEYILETVSLILIFVFLAVMKSAVSGKLKNVYNWGLRGRKDIKETHDAIPRIEDKVEEIDENFTEHSYRVNQKLDEHNRRMENVEETIAIIHVDDADVNEEPLKTKLGVDQLNTDIKDKDD